MARRKSGSSIIFRLGVERFLERLSLFLALDLLLCVLFAGAGLWVVETRAAGILADAQSAEWTGAVELGGWSVQKRSAADGAQPPPEWLQGLLPEESEQAGRRLSWGASPSLAQRLRGARYTLTLDTGETGRERYIVLTAEIGPVLWAAWVCLVIILCWQGLSLLGACIGASRTYSRILRPLWELTETTRALSAGEKLTPEELQKVEYLVNEEILRDDPVDIREMPIDEAKKLGAMALFGEKYGDMVRVVKMGDFSIELCGGTHVPNTARVGLLKILSEASVAAGVRRVEAVVGQGVIAMLQERDALIAHAAAAIKAAPVELVHKAEQMMGELRQASHQVEVLNARVAAMRSVELLNFARTAGDSGVNVLAMQVEDVTPDMLRTLSDSLRDKAPNLVSVLALVHDGKINFVAACGKEAVKKGAHAGNILKQIAKIAGGGGGGRPDSATAGGKDVSKLEEALEAVNNIVEQMVK